MKIDAVGVTTSNIGKTVAFYSLLGFQFPEFKDNERHLEPNTPEGSARLMIDTKDLVKEIIGENPNPGNHSMFAIHYSSVDELNKTVEKVKDAGYKIAKEPWNAFWGQRYAIVEDPDGYKVDLYAAL